MKHSELLIAVALQAVEMDIVLQKRQPHLDTRIFLHKSFAPLIIREKMKGHNTFHVALLLLCTSACFAFQASPGRKSEEHVHS